MIPEYVDIHAHLNFAAFEVDREEVIKRALDAGVWMVNVGTQKNTSKAALDLAEKYERGIYAIVGLHPIHTSKSYHDEQELGGGEGFTSRGEVFEGELYKSMAMKPKVLAIGECGLDYFNIDNEEAVDKQMSEFKKQIELSIEVGKPLMLHLRNSKIRSAYKDAFNILKSYVADFKIPVPANLHFFAGNTDEAKPFLDLGCTFSFTGVITFTRDYDEIIKYLPMEQILSETDCPYVAPEPFRGRRNEPMHVREVVKQIAEVRGISLEKTRESIGRNARRLFGAAFQ